MNINIFTHIITTESSNGFNKNPLASAAIYLRQVQQNKETAKFGWNDYVEELNKGQRRTTEAILLKLTHATKSPRPQQYR